MTESVFAWKRGETALAREILAPLPLDRDASHLALYQLAVACFAAAVGGACDRGRRMTLARRAVQQAAPTLAVQCLALLAEQARADRAALRRMARRLRLPARGAEFTRRREFLSVADSLAILGRR
jgi:hypothetical protein